MRKILTWLLAAIAAAMLVAVLVSLSGSNQWFVRAVDLVREPVTYLAIALAILAAIFAARWKWVIVAAFLAVAVINVARIWPYVPLAGQQVALQDGEEPEGQCFTAYSLNVKQENSDHDGVIAQIEAVDPDLLLLMETDDVWAEALSGVVSEYEHTLIDAKSNAYGMIFASRLPVQSAKTIENTARNTPTLYATIALPNGRDFEFVGLHPKPPLPGQDTGKRDANIARAGARTPDGKAEALVMGDFNDVPWSGTTTKFRKEGGWRDPRIGRGAYPTFPSERLILGYPLDQLMVKNDLTVASFEVMEGTGSDHRAMKAVLCLGEKPGPVENVPEMMEPLASEL